MLTKIHDWIDFFEEAIFDLRTGDDWRDKFEGVWAGLQDLVFHGGRVCNWHGELLCKKCYSKEFIAKARKEFAESIMSDEDWLKLSPGTTAR